ncbi:hypothetical protein I552_8961 [Mycobacterium xenopi 3993]|nr:hypothetical protein I552_8961 [Mycobacterium xenopi 3993]
MQRRPPQASRLLPARSYRLNDGSLGHPSMLGPHIMSGRSGAQATCR